MSSRKNVYDEMIIIIVNAIIMLKETDKYGELSVEELAMELGAEQYDFPRILKELEERNG